MLIAGDLLDGLTGEGAEEAPEDVEGLKVSALVTYTLGIISVISCIRTTSSKNTAYRQDKDRTVVSLLRSPAKGAHDEVYW